MRHGFIVPGDNIVIPQWYIVGFLNTQVRGCDFHSYFFEGRYEVTVEGGRLSNTSVIVVKNIPP